MTMMCGKTKIYKISARLSLWGGSFYCGEFLNLATHVLQIESNLLCINEFTFHLYLKLEYNIINSSTLNSENDQLNKSISRY